MYIISTFHTQTVSLAGFTYINTVYSDWIYLREKTVAQQIPYSSILSSSLAPSRLVDFSSDTKVISHRLILSLVD